MTDPIILDVDLHTDHGAFCLDVAYWPEVSPGRECPGEAAHAEVAPDSEVKWCDRYALDGRRLPDLIVDYDDLAPHLRQAIDEHVAGLLRDGHLAEWALIEAGLEVDA